MHPLISMCNSQVLRHQLAGAMLQKSIGLRVQLVVLRSQGNGLIVCQFFFKN